MVVQRRGLREKYAIERFRIIVFIVFIVTRGKNTGKITGKNTVTILAIKAIIPNLGVK